MGWKRKTNKQINMYVKEEKRNNNNISNNNTATILQVKHNDYVGVVLMPRTPWSTSEH